MREADAADVTALRALDRSTGTPVGRTDSDYISRTEGLFCRRVLTLRDPQAGIVGFLIASAIGADWELENVVVTESMRKHGLGRQLIRELIGSVRRLGGRTIRLEVRSSNKSAIRMYEACGFQAQGIRKAYYSNPEEDALLFSLFLENST